uniref:Photosystem II reaction center protein Z n=1 Tax=Phacus orbicularis TaxID=158829 RepID=A0A182B0Z3_9EUGL|nr:photosystem II protein Z [Phacus orbicularis]
MNVIFQLALLLLVTFSFLMVIGVPVVFASPNGWNENKNYILFSAAIWSFLVILVGTLNSFVV